MEVNHACTLQPLTNWGLYINHTSGLGLKIRQSTVIIGNYSQCIATNQSTGGADGARDYNCVTIHFYNEQINAGYRKLLSSSLKDQPSQNM